jgi:catechol 2,3-dioxygenase-like lactoylglutathione lyase family enzyme
MNPRIAYVALAAADPSACCDFLGQQLGLSCTPLPAGNDHIPVYAAGESALAVFPLGHPLIDGEARAGIHHLAIGVDDPAAIAGELAAAGLGPIERCALPALGGEAQFALDRSATCDVRIRLTAMPDLSRARSTFVERIDHIGVASRDNGQAEQVFRESLGLTYESRQTDMEVALAMESFTSDKYGVVYHTRAAQPIGGLRVSFLSIGDCELEFLQDFDPRYGVHVERGAPGNTRQDQSAIARFIASRGAGLHHIALNTTDIDATLAHLHRQGLALIDQIGRPGSRRARIGFAQPTATGGILFHFCER